MTAADDAREDQAGLSHPGWKSDPPRDAEQANATRTEALVEHFFRHEYGGLLAGLVRRFGVERLDLAEDALQEAMARAVRIWPVRGIPDRPAAWLWRVAYRCAIDQLRRERKIVDGGEQSIEATQSVEGLPSDDPPDMPVQDEVLAMMVMCCHPAFSRPTRTALTLKSVAGFGTPEIARAFLLPEATIAQRIVRAKRMIRAGEVRLEMPSAEQRWSRLGAVLDVVYLIFSEGYGRYGDVTDEPSEGLPFGHELIAEAIRLGDIIASSPFGQTPQVDALRALMALQSSRLSARLDAGGALVPLAKQDRTLWDIRSIDKGLILLARASRGRRVTSFHLLAGIAACHATAEDEASTDWQRILQLYDDLLATSPSDVVIRINRAVALSRVEGARSALIDVDSIARDPRSERYPELIALKGDLLERLDRFDEARNAFGFAAEIATSSAARRALLRREREVRRTRTGSAS